MGEEVALHEDKELVDILIKRGNKIQYTMVNPNSRYMHNLARIKPFLISKGRSILSKIAEPIVEDIVYCNTDGFITTKNQHDSGVIEIRKD